MIPKVTHGIVHEIIVARFETLEGMNLVTARTVLENSDNTEVLTEAKKEFQNSVKVCVEHIKQLEALIHEQYHQIKILKGKCRDQENTLSALTKKIKIDEAHVATGINLLRGAVRSVIHKMQKLRVSK